MGAHGNIAALSTALLLASACATPPSDSDMATLGQVGYRNGDDGPNSGERGCMKMSEILWTGSLTNDGTYDRSDIFLEFRNECARPMNMNNWLLELSGANADAWRMPLHTSGQEDWKLDVGRHAYLATKDTGCFGDPDWIIPDFRVPYGDAFRITLRDADERLQEPIGSRTQPPFAGGYDLVQVRSMERLEIMFGGRGNEPESWHYYTTAPVDVPNNDRVAEGCRERTLASPGRPNSPDYSGAYSSGNLD